MACTQAQEKKFPWTPERSAALFRDMRDNYVAKGETDMSKIVDSLSAKYNLKREFIIQGLDLKGSPKRLSNEVWLRQQNARYATEQAKRMVTQMNTPVWKQTAAKAIEAPRRLVLAGHFAAFSKSHLSDQLFYNTAEYYKNFTQSWHLATERGRVLHEQRMAQAFSDTDPDYVDARRAGLVIGKSRTFESEVRESTGQVGKHTPKRSELAFEELAMRRLEIWKKEIARLSPDERGNLDQLKDLASVMNHDTGTVIRSNAAMRFMFLSPRLFPGQLAHTFVDLPKALFETGIGFRYKQAAPAMRYVARKAAILASAQTALLALNQAYYKFTGDEKFKPDLDPTNVRAGSFRMKLFGYSIPTSPTMELLKLPVAMINAGVRARAGDNRLVDALSEGLKVAIGRQNPIFSLAEQAVFGQDPRSGRPTWFPGLVTNTLPTKHKETISGAEWFFTQTPIPIPVSNYLREFFDELKDHGMPPKDGLAWVRMLGIPTAELATSYHLSKSYEQPPQKPQTNRQRERKKQEAGLIERGYKSLTGQ